MGMATFRDNRPESRRWRTQAKPILALLSGASTAILKAKPKLEKRSTLTPRTNDNALDKPIISVVIPVYNAQEYLPQCLDSVLNSTFRDIEVVCVDDGSTDRSAQILSAYHDADARVRIIAQEHRSAAAARNTGIRAATGAYIHFLDADDWIESIAYEKWYNLAQTYDADVFTCLHVNVDAKSGAVLSEGAYPDTNATVFPNVTNFHEKPDALIYGNVVPWDKLYSRAFLSKHGILFDDLPCAEDRAFYYDVIYRAKSIVRTTDKWVYHRLNIPGSLDGSSIRLEHFGVEFKSFEHIWSLLETATPHAKAMALDNCIFDSFYYYGKAKGTPFENDIARQLLEYWRPYLPILGAAAYEKSWYRDLIEIALANTPSEYRESILGLHQVYLQKPTEVHSEIRLLKKGQIVATRIRKSIAQAMKANNHR